MKEKDGPNLDMGVGMKTFKSSQSGALYQNGARVRQTTTRISDPRGYTGKGFQEKLFYEAGAAWSRCVSKKCNRATKARLSI